MRPCGCNDKGKHKMSCRGVPGAEAATEALPPDTVASDRHCALASYHAFFAGCGQPDGIPIRESMIYGKRREIFIGSGTTYRPKLLN